MTQALNLANFANKLNTSGQADNTSLQSGTYNIDISGNAATATSVTSFATANFSILESGGKLIFKYGATTIASLDSSGNFIVIGNVAAGGTP
jgi:hypothetical protein